MKFGLTFLVLYGFFGVTAQSEITIIEKDEPGILFSYEITVQDIYTKKPIPGARVFVYQTNSVGDYESTRPQDARISGTLVTNAHGKGIVNTIFPRGYNNAETGEHIHYKVEANGYESSNPTLIFADFYNKRYNFNKPVLYKAYLKNMENLANGSRKGNVTLYLKSK